MSCITVKQEDYIFDASAKKITLKNLEIEQKFIRGIYNLNTANNEAIYTGVGDKGGSVVFNGGHTELTLEYNTVPMTDTDELRIDIALDAFEFLFASTPTASALPSGALPTINPILNTEPNVIDTGWIYVDDYFKGGQLFYALCKGTDLKVYLMNSSDSSGNLIFGDTTAIPINDGIPLLSGFEFPNKYFRAVIVNDSGASATEYIVKSTARQSPPNNLYQTVGAPIPLGTPAETEQSFILGRDDINTAVSSVVDVNVGQLTNSLAVHVGNRSSETAGRIPHDIAIENFSTSQELDGSWGVNPLTGNPYKFYCTSIFYAISNSSVLVDASVYIREVDVNGRSRIPIRVEESVTGTGGIDKVYSDSWSDSNRPIIFNTAVYFDIIAGDVELDINLYGYLE